MVELYWVTTLGNLHFVLSIILVTSIVIIVSGGILFVLALIDTGPKELKNVMCHKFPKFIFGISILGIIYVFVPSKQDLYLIYGLGTIVDYVQDNKELKEIPDNAIEAINNWLIEENSKNN